MRERCIVLSEPGLLGWFIRFQSRLSQKGRHWSFSIKQMRQFSRSGLPAKENTPCSSSIRTSKVLAKIIIKLTLLNFIFGLQVDNIHRENDEQDWGKSDIYFAKINTDRHSTGTGDSASYLLQVGFVYKTFIVNYLFVEWSQIGSDHQWPASGWTIKWINLIVKGIICSYPVKNLPRYSKWIGWG